MKNETQVYHSTALGYSATLTRTASASAQYGGRDMMKRVGACTPYRLTLTLLTLSFGLAVADCGGASSTLAQTENPENSGAETTGAAEAVEPKPRLTPLELCLAEPSVCEDNMSWILDRPRSELDGPLSLAVKKCAAGDWNGACASLNDLLYYANQPAWSKRSVDLRALLQERGLSKDTLLLAAAPACLEHGDAYACLRAGAILRYDKNQAGDATRYFRRGCAGEHFEARACRLLAYSFREGAGVPQSDGNAKEFFRRACKAGDQEACDELMKLGEVVVAEGRQAPAPATPVRSGAPPQQTGSEPSRSDDDLPAPRAQPARSRERRHWSTRVSGSGSNSVESLACAEAKTFASGSAITACGIDGRAVARDMGDCRCSSSGVKGFSWTTCTVSLEISCDSKD